MSNEISNINNNRRTEKKVEREYKMTSIGEIPVDWDVVKLGKISSFKNGINFSNELKGEKGIPTIDVLNMYGNDINVNLKELYRLDVSLKDKKDYLLQKGDILFVRSSLKKEGTGWASLFNGWHEPATFCGFIIRARLSDKNVSPKFLTYFLRSDTARNDLIKNSGQVTISNITQESLKTVEIPMPSLQEQKKIAEILSTNDQAINKSDEIIAKTRLLKKGIMQKILTHGVGHKKFKDSEIGRIPEKWNILPLKNLINLKSGQYFKFSEFSDEGVRCLKIDNVGFGRVEWDSITYLPEDYVNKFPDLVLQEGDIVIALNRPIIKNKLKVGILKENDAPSILYQRVGKVVFKNKKITKEFLFFLLSGDYFKNQLSRYLIGTDQPYIRTPVFLGINIALPELQEQRKISKILLKVDEKIEKELKRKEKLQNIKTGLMNDLLSGRKRVKIDN